MIPILIDTLDLSSEFNLTRDDIDGLLEYTVQEITKEFALVWEAEAKNALFASRKEYIDSIRVDSRGRFSGVAYLDPITFLANAVEVGAPEFDMKTALLNSPKAKTNAKGGRYITIPFRFATPGSIGESSAFAGVMPTAIYKAVQKEEASGSGGGLKMSGIPSSEQMPQSHSMRRELKSEGFAKLKQGTAMTSKYEGLQRNAVGSGYVTFRRVSDNSDPAAFIHPGIAAKNLIERAEAKFLPTMAERVDMLIDNYLVSLGF